MLMNDSYNTICPKNIINLLYARDKSIPVLNYYYSLVRSLEYYKQGLVDRSSFNLEFGNLKL